MDDTAQMRHAIEALASNSYCRHYPAELRVRIVAHAERQLRSGRTTWEVARSLGCFAPVWRHLDATGRIELTTSELSLFLKGSEVVARRSLSPPRFDRAAQRALSAADFR